MSSIAEFQKKVKHSHQLRITNYGDGSDEGASEYVFLFWRG